MARGGACRGLGPLASCNAVLGGFTLQVMRSLCQPQCSNDPATKPTTTGGTVSTAKKNVKVWDTESGQELLTLQERSEESEAWHSARMASAWPVALGPGR